MGVGRKNNISKKQFSDEEAGTTVTQEFFYFSRNGKHKYNVKFLKYIAFEKKNSTMNSAKLTCGQLNLATRIFN